MNITQNGIDVHSLRLRNKYIRIESLDFDFNVLEMFQGVAVSGSLTFSADNDLRKSGNITMAVPLFYDLSTFSYSNDNMDLEYGGKVWLDKYIRISVGIENYLSNTLDTEYKNTQQISWFNMGIYLITSPSISTSSTTRELSFSCLDMMARYSGLRSGQLTNLTTNIVSDSYNSSLGVYVRQKTLEVILAILDLANINKYSIADIPVESLYIPYDITFNETTSIMNMLIAVRDILPNWEFYFDREGTFVFKPIPTGDFEPYAPFDQIENVISNETSVNFDNVKNQVIVYGNCITSTYTTTQTLISYGDEGVSLDLYFSSFIPTNLYLNTSFISFQTPNYQSYQRIQDVFSEAYNRVDFISINIGTPTSYTLVANLYLVNYGSTFDYNDVELQYKNVISLSQLAPDTLYCFNIVNCSYDATTNKVISLTNGVAQLYSKQQASSVVVIDSVNSPYFINNGLSIAPSTTPYTNTNYYLGMVRLYGTFGYGSTTILNAYDFTNTNQTQYQVGDVVTFMVENDNLENPTIAYYVNGALNTTVMVDKNDNILPQGICSNNYTIYKAQYCTGTNDENDTIYYFRYLGRLDTALTLVLSDGDYSKIPNDYYCNERAKYESYLYGNTNDNISINCVPNYMLDVNMKIPYESLSINPIQESKNVLDNLTDNFISRETANGNAIGENINANIGTLGGNSVKQLINKDNFPASDASAVSNITYTNNGDGSVIVVIGEGGASANRTIRLLSNMPIPTYRNIQKKIYFSGSMFKGTNSTIALREAYSSSIDEGNGIIYTLSTTGLATISISIKSGCPAGTYVFKPQLIDLTELGWDTLTIPQIKQRITYLLPYGISDSQVGGLTSTALNWFDQNTILVENGFTYNSVDNSFYVADPSSLDQKVLFRNNGTTGSLKVMYQMKNTQTVSGVAGAYIMCQYTDNTSEMLPANLTTDYKTYYFISNNNKTVDKFVWGYGNSSNSTYVKEFAIYSKNFPTGYDTSTTIITNFLPYTQNTLQFSKPYELAKISNTSLTYQDKLLQVDNSLKVLQQNVIKTLMTNLTWTLTVISSNYIYTSNSLSSVLVYSSGLLPLILCDLYTRVVDDETTYTNQTISILDNGIIQIVDNSRTTLSAFTTYIANRYIEYAINSPIVIPINENDTYIANEYGTENIKQDTLLTTNTPVYVDTVISYLTQDTRPINDYMIKNITFPLDLSSSQSINAMRIWEQLPYVLDTPTINLDGLVVVISPIAYATQYDIYINGSYTDTTFNTEYNLVDNPQFSRTVVSLNIKVKATHNRLYYSEFSNNLSYTFTENYSDYYGVTNLGGVNDQYEDITFVCSDSNVNNQVDITNISNGKYYYSNGHNISGKTGLDPFIAQIMNVTTPNTTYTVTDSEGNVFVKFRKLYRKIVQSNDQTNNDFGLYLSFIRYDKDYKPYNCFWDDTQNKYVDYIYVAKFVAGIDSDNDYLTSKTAQTIGLFPLNEPYVDNFRTYAKNISSNYYLMDVNIRQMINDIFCVYFNTSIYATNGTSLDCPIGNSGTLNTATGGGENTFNTASNTYFIAQQTTSANNMRFLGLENIWGNCPQMLDGLYAYRNHYYVSYNTNSYGLENNGSKDLTYYNKLNYTLPLTYGSQVNALGYDTNNSQYQLPMLPTTYSNANFYGYFNITNIKSATTPPYYIACGGGNGTTGTITTNTTGLNSYIDLGRHNGGFATCCFRLVTKTLA